MNTENKAITKHGGRRKNSGAKQKYGEPTKVIRVPISLIPQIKVLLLKKEEKRKKKPKG